MNPLMTKKRLAIGGAVLTLAIAAIAVGVWYFVIRGDSPPPVSLEAAVTVATESPTPSEPQASAYSAASAPPQTDSGAQPDAEGDAASAVAAPDPSAPQGLVGTWTVIADGRSFAGYRVQEELGGIGANTAAGRTTNVSGTLTFDGAAITAVDIDVDLTTLRSDDSRRDGALRGRGLEWGTFPTATFTLTAPIPHRCGARGGRATRIHHHRRVHPPRRHAGSAHRP